LGLFKYPIIYCSYCFFSIWQDTSSSGREAIGFVMEAWKVVCKDIHDKIKTKRTRQTVEVSDYPYLHPLYLKDAR
jgi:hypothetical protein